MYTKQIKNYVENLSELRDFVESVSSFLTKATNDELEHSIGDLFPFVLALSKLNPELPPNDKGVQLLNKLYGEDITLVVNKDSKGNTQIGFKCKGQAGKRSSDAFSRFHRTLNRNRKLYNTALISLVSSAEWFVSQLIHEYYEKNRDASDIKDKMLSLGDLFQIGNIEDARKFLIDKKAESILRGDVLDWIGFFKKDLHLSMSYLELVENDLLEICKRRNVLVHNGGVVNSIYLNSLPKGYKSEFSLNEVITISEQYLEQSICCFELAFVLIGMELWKNQEPKSESRGNILTELAFSHIKAGRYKVGEQFAFFILNDRKLNSTFRSIAALNYWQALKWQNRFSEIEKQVQEADFSDKELKFELGRQVLLNNFDKALKLLPQAIKNESISVEAILNWPIFKEFRLDNRVLKIIKKQPEAKPAELNKLKSLPLKNTKVARKKISNRV